MKLYLYKAVAIFLIVFIYCSISNAQSPGLIIDPQNGNGITFLNPNGDKYSSATSAGFTTSDITQSEIAYKIVPAAITEPVGDQNGGSTGGPTDFVPGSNGSAFYAFYDGTNIMFRFRTGGYSTGSRGYSVLIDTDLKFGNTGFYADPNYVAPSSSNSGNPGFELEIVYEGNKRVAIYNVDGTVNGTLIASYALNTNSQVSVALTRTTSDADYFTDFGVPVTALGNPQYLRMVGTTVNSANSALGGNVSDVFGVNDLPKKNLENNWKKIIDNQCGFSVSALSLSGSGICVCTPRPTVYSPVAAGTNITVSGMWNRLDTSKSLQATITLFKNNVAVGTTTATTGVTWSIIVSSINSGDTLYAKAQAAPEFMCLQSDPVYAGCSTTPPATPVITCASHKGMSGTIPLYATVDIYQISTFNSNPYTTKLTTGLVYTNNATNTTFDYYGSNTQSGTPCSGGSPQLSSTSSYMIVVNQGGCLSAPYFMCVNTNSWNSPSLNTLLTLSAPITANQTTVTGSGGNWLQTYRLFINGQFAASAYGSISGTYTFNNLVLKSGDQLQVWEQSSNSTCQTYSNTYSVTCYTGPPSIFATTYLTTDTEINGYSSYPGATVSLYRGTYPSGTLAGTAIVSNGSWLVNGLTLSAGETYYAVQNFGCNSTASTITTIVAPTVICPVITGSYAESSTSVSGTLASTFTGTIRLYEDGALIGSTSVTNATTWTIAVNQDLVYYTDRLFSTGVLTVTAQTSGSGEKIDCPSTTTVTCDLPVTPVATPASVTISQGDYVTFSINNTVNKNLYSVIDINDSAYATSVFGNGSTQNLQTKPFNTPGTYALKVTADNIGGPHCRTTYDVNVTVNSIVLPVKFINFSARNTDDKNFLTWNVSNEINVKYYQVERSNNCNNFNVIGIVNYKVGNVSSNTYNFTDNSFSGNACYRIMQVNTDGKISYSDIINVTSSKKLYIKVAPNPAKNKATLFVPSETERFVTIEILNMNGKKMQTKMVKLQAGHNAIALYNLNYGKGTYLVKVYDFKSFQHIKLVLQ
jgi:plastocyanin